MAKENKKRRRKAPTEKEKPKGVLRFDPDIGVTYVKLIVRYRACVTKCSDLKDQMDWFTSMGGVEHKSSNVSSEIEQLDQDIHQLKLRLVDIGGKLKQESYEADIDADVIKRTELRGWLDDSLDEDLCVRLDEWRCAQKRKQDGPVQETTSDVAPVDQANGDGEKSDRTGRDDVEAESDTPLALTPNQTRVLVTMSRFDGSRLLSPKMIREEMDIRERLSERTIRGIVQKLIGHDLAERPEGKRQGTRLKIEGRRLVPKIAD